MGAFTISLLVGIFIFVFLGAVEGLILGDKGKQDNIPQYFAYLKGEKEKKPSVQNKDIRSNESTSKKTYYYYSILISIGFFLVALIAFKSLLLALILSLFGLIYPKAMMQSNLLKKREKCNLHFRDALNSIMGSLKAGLSINSSIIKCYDDLNKIYTTPKDRYIVDEFNKIKNDLSMGISIDDALRRFKQRMEMEDVDDFVNSVIIVRQKGGNMLEIMENVTKMISDKISIKNEIKVFTSQKKFEAKILTIVPVFLIITLSIFSPDYMEPLYATFLGKILIIFGFVLLIANYFFGKKITNINV